VGRTRAGITCGRYRPRQARRARDHRRQPASGGGTGSWFALTFLFAALRRAANPSVRASADRRGKPEPTRTTWTGCWSSSAPGFRAPRGPFNSPPPLVTAKITVVGGHHGRAASGTAHTSRRTPFRPRWSRRTPQSWDLGHLHRAARQITGRCTVRYSGSPLRRRLRRRRRNTPSVTVGGGVAGTAGAPGRYPVTVAHRRLVTGRGNPWTIVTRLDPGHRAELRCDVRRRRPRSDWRRTSRRLLPGLFEVRMTRNSWRLAGEAPRRSRITLLIRWRNRDMGNKMGWSVSGGGRGSGE